MDLFQGLGVAYLTILMHKNGRQRHRRGTHTTRHTVQPRNPEEVRR